jgi:hypothetical protein
MDSYTVAVIGLIVLALVVLGSVLIFRALRKGPMEPSTVEGAVAFKDCYDLEPHAPGRDPSNSFTTMCSHHGGA